MKDYSGAPEFALNFCRVLVGLFFMLNGIAKLIGVFGWEVVESGSRLWWAGVIETTGGFMLMLGIATRVAALLVLLQMIAAYYLVHIPQAWLPNANQNGGERALLYGLWGFFFMVVGGGSFSVDGLLAARKRERAG